MKKIDNVRKITNSSSDKLGMTIANHLLQEVVANDLATIRNGEHIGYIIDKNNEIEEAHGKDDIAETLVRRINYGK